MTDRYLGFFGALQFRPAYWELSPERRRAAQDQLLACLDGTGIHYDLYQAYPLHSQVDLVVWCTAVLSETSDPDGFFSRLARALNPLRHLLETRRTLWGMTRPSDYARGKSEQEIDPLNGPRSRYLVVYPFTKTAEWYRLSRDTRQGMMNEHIRSGHQYPQIKQLLLYSTGLQEQEFVVTYETDDLVQFSALVTDLRGSEARRFTAADTPVYTAVYREPRETLALFG